MEDRLRWRNDVRLQRRVDAVGGHDDIGFDDRAIREADSCQVAVLRKTDGSVAGVNHAIRQIGGEKVNQVGSMHPEDGIPPASVRHLNRRDRRSVVTVVVRTGPHPRAHSLHGRAKAQAFEMAYRVRRCENAGTDLAERRRLLVDRDVQALRNERVGGEKPANTATDNHHVWAAMPYPPLGEASDHCARVKRRPAAAFTTPLSRLKAEGRANIYCGTR